MTSSQEAKSSSGGPSAVMLGVLSLTCIATSVAMVLRDPEVFGFGFVVVLVVGAVLLAVALAIHVASVSAGRRVASFFAWLAGYAVLAMVATGMLLILLRGVT